MSTVAKPRLFTVEEYLAFDRSSEFKHEYRDGEIVAMTGASLPHNRIVVNLIVLIQPQILGRGCEAFVNDMRVCIEPDGLYAYPDLVAVCGEPALLDDLFDTVLNPSLVIEVLSPSTEAYDRGRKSERYRRVETLRDFLLIAQDRVGVEHWKRWGEDWALTTFSQLDDVIRLGSVGCDVPLAAIYAHVVRLGEGPGVG